MARFLILLCLLLPACALQRSSDAGNAQKKMIGMSQEQVFTCMGIPIKKGKVGNTEIWLYKSGNGYSRKNKQSASASFSGAIKSALMFSDSEKRRRFCRISIVMRNKRVRTVNYNGPTGGFLTEDEQCAYAVRNCLKPTPSSL